MKANVSFIRLFLIEIMYSRLLPGTNVHQVHRLKKFPVTLCYECDRK